MAEDTGRILVVDDNATNRLKLLLGLEHQGHSVSLAENGSEALRMLQEQPYDVVLLDIVMPEMDGYAVLAEMKGNAELRNVPVIVISAVDELDSAVRCIEMGAEDYLPKTFNPVFLKARIDASLRRKKLRDLEQAYLQQDIKLRQSEKLATLGRLSAGMAHELNNPAAAAQRGIEQMRSAFEKQMSSHLALAASNLSALQVTVLQELPEQVKRCLDNAATMDPLARSDRESELESWLSAHGIDNAWEVAPDLVTLGYDPESLSRLGETFRADQMASVLTWLVSVFSIYTVLRQAREGTRRISDIVGALKNYTYLDQAPIQRVDVHEGLESTIVLLNNRLQQGVIVYRQYAQDLPIIDAYGNELNQVWTNIIDNAISAMNGRGEITLHTHQETDFVVVEITDNGPGIPEDIQSRIFDPFFTTKPPGEGVGLGLNISHNIIVQKHRGKIAVTSQPGHTSFQVRLPFTIDNV